MKKKKVWRLRATRFAHFTPFEEEARRGAEEERKRERDRDRDLSQYVCCCRGVKEGVFGRNKSSLNIELTILTPSS